VSHLSGKDFASLLDKAIERSDQARDVKQIEHRSEEGQ
jgi:hypothetical protein